MPAHIHGYRALNENGVNIQIKAICARNLEDAKRFRNPTDGVPPPKLHVASFEKRDAEEVKKQFFPFGIKDVMALETLESAIAIKERREMETSGHEGLGDLAVSYALIESSLTGKPIKVGDVKSGKIGNYEKEINEYYEL